MKRKKGRQRLTDLELELMQVVWEAEGRPRTVREIAAAHAARSGKELAYTTVQTVLGILCKKRVLASRPGPARAHLYRALVSRDEATSTLARDLVERLFAGRAQPLLAHLLEHEDIGRDELEALRRIIDAQLEDEP